jgi:hypothetical protein
VFCGWVYGHLTSNSHKNKRTHSDPELAILEQIKELFKFKNINSLFLKKRKKKASHITYPKVVGFFVGFSIKTSNLWKFLISRNYEHLYFSLDFQYGYEKNNN